MLRPRVEIFQFLRRARGADALSGARDLLQSLGRAETCHRVARFGEMLENSVTRAEPAVVARGKDDEVAGMPVMHRANVGGVNLWTQRMNRCLGHRVHARLRGETGTAATGQDGQARCSERASRAHAGSVRLPNRVCLPR